MKRVLAAFILTACAVSFAQAQTIQMKLGHYAAPTHPGTEASRMFAQGGEQRTRGEVRIAVYPDNELGTPDEVLSKCLRGTVDMALPYHGHLGKYARKFYSVMLPYAFDSYVQADRVLDGPFIAWAAPELEAAGLEFLSNWEWGFRNITSGRRPVNSASDMRGLMVPRRGGRRARQRQMRWESWRQLRDPPLFQPVWRERLQRTLDQQSVPIRKAILDHGCHPALHHRLRRFPCQGDPFSCTARSTPWCGSSLPGAGGWKGLLTAMLRSPIE